MMFKIVRVCVCVCIDAITGNPYISALDSSWSIMGRDSFSSFIYHPTILTAGKIRLY